MPGLLFIDDYGRTYAVPQLLWNTQTGSLTINGNLILGNNKLFASDGQTNILVGNLSQWHQMAPNTKGDQYVLNTQTGFWHTWHFEGAGTQNDPYVQIISQNPISIP